MLIDIKMKWKCCKWYRVFYDIEGGELIRAQSFDDEHEMHSKRQFNYK